MSDPTAHRSSTPGGDKPTLSVLLPVIPRIAVSWYALGLQLGAKYYTLDNTKQRHKNDPEKCCSEILLNWLISKPHCGDCPRTWDGLLPVVQSVVGSEASAFIKKEILNWEEEEGQMEHAQRPAGMTQTEPMMTFAGVSGQQLPAMGRAQQQHQPPPTYLSEDSNGTTPHSTQQAQQGLPLGRDILPQVMEILQRTGMASASTSNSSSPSIASGSIADMEKLKLIQQHLVVLLHAYKCMQRERESENYRCVLPHCKPMKEVLRHTMQCTRTRDCNYPHCNSSRQIIQHWRSCGRYDCSLCMPVKAVIKPVASRVSPGSAMPGPLGPAANSTTSEHGRARAKAMSDFKESLDIALDKGSVEVEIVKCVTLGPPEAGKTQLKSALVGRFDHSDESTPISTGAEVVMQRYITGKTSWEPLTREKLKEAFQKTIEEMQPSQEAVSDNNEMSKLLHSQPLSAADKLEQACTDTASDVQTERTVLQEQFHTLRKSVEESFKETEDAAKASDRMSLQKVRMIHLIDSGGQPAFFDIHPVIATSRAVYFLVYNMEEGLEAKPKITYRKKDIDFPVKEMPNTVQSNLDMIVGSLLTLQHCKEKFIKMEGEIHRWFRELISESDDAVPVLVVGTRKKMETVEHESKKLAAGCSQLPFWKEVLPCTLTGTNLFPVNSVDPTCDGVQSLRDAITEAECTYKLHLPISWLFCQLIFWSAGENLQTLPFSDLSDLCQSEGLVSDHHEFLAMVRTFHLLGIFSFPYFDQELTLGDQWKPDSHPVFTNPDVLYRQVTKILEVAFHRLEITKMKHSKRRSLKELQSNGHLTADTLAHLGIPDQLGSYIGFRSYLLERLVHWGLAARLAVKDSVDSTDNENKFEYFIPSVFPACDQAPFCFPTEGPIPHLALTFQDSVQDGKPVYYVPLGIFPHLIVNIISEDKGYSIQHNTDSYKCLFRDAAIFVIKPSSCSMMEHSYNVRLTDDKDHISISIRPSHVEMRRSDHDCHQIIRDLQSAIEDAYERIYCTRRLVTLACPCPCGRISKHHLAAILSRPSTPAKSTQECLSTECPHWVRDCPEDIAAIVNQSATMASEDHPTHILSFLSAALAAPPSGPTTRSMHLDDMTASETGESSVSGLKRPPAHEETASKRSKEVEEGTTPEVSQIIKEHAQTFLQEMNSEAIASTLKVLDLIPASFEGCIKQCKCREDANSTLLSYLKEDATEEQMHRIFEIASETVHGRMSEFAANILQRLQQVTPTPSAMTDPLRNELLSSKPTAVPLLKAVVPSVAHKWHQLGVNLGVESAILKTFKSTELHDLKLCCLEMFECWLQESRGTGESPRTWSSVLSAVGDCLGRDVADSIERALLEERQQRKQSSWT